MKFVRALIMMSALATPALANLPTWDNTGNSLLSGTYYFREVIYVVSDSAGDLSGIYSTYGTINFNGSGGYTIGSATENACTSSGCGQQPLTSSTTGTYTFGAAGYGFFTNPLSSSIIEYGLVSNGILVASATEAGYNTLFIAVPVPSPVSTNGSFQGNYQMAGFFPGSGAASGASGATYQLNPDGAGNLGTVSITGYGAGTGSQVFTQTSSVKYSFVNGAGVITFPTSSSANFYSGQEYLYISPDHNFVFGGSPTGFDMFVGVKTSPNNVNFSGTYYEAGLDWDATQLSALGYSAMDTYYGSFNAISGGNIIGHERLYYGLSQSTSGFTYTNAYPSTVSTGSYTVTSGSYQTQYTFGNGGAVRIGFGVGASLGIAVALQAPTLSGTGSGPYANPQGLVNAASFAPFTTGVSPGEYVALFGNNLAPGLTVASSTPLPTTLNGVTVTVNGVQAPLFFVSPGQLNFVIPTSAYYTPTSGRPIARIVVTNAAGVSNAITAFFNQTSPGIFTTASGLGNPLVYHVTASGYSLVTSSNPAQPGETVVTYLSGMGETLPSVPEGSVAPSSPLASTTGNFDVYVGGNEACGVETNATPCPFIGLAPGLADVYQVNIPIPSTATAGTNSIEVIGPDSDNFQVSIPVGTGVGATSDRTGPEPSDVRSRSSKQTRPAEGLKPRLQPCFITDPVCSGRSL